MIPTLTAEADSRHNSTIKRLLQQAHLPGIKTLDGYDWNRLTLPEGLTPTSLENLDFLTGHEDLICYGDVGCGKTHLATALTRQACLLRSPCTIHHRSRSRHDPTQSHNRRQARP